MRTVTLTVIFPAIMWFAAPALSQTGASGAAESAIAGAWRLDHQASDRGGTAGDAGGAGGRHGGRPPGGGGGFGGHGGGGFGGHGGGSRGGYGDGSPEDRERMKDRMERVRSMMEAAERLTITETPEYVSLVDGDGRVEKLVPNGKKEKHLVGNTQADVRTQWEEGRLVSEIDLGDGVKFKRTISADTASDGARRLTIELKPEGDAGGGRPPLRRVYDQVE